MADYIKVKPDEMNSGPKGGIYVTKEERNRTILTAAILFSIAFLKRKIRKRFRR